MLASRLSSLPLLALTACLVLASGCRGSRDAGATTMAGTWTGEGQQWNSGDRTMDPDEEWDLRVTLVDAAGGYAGTVEYPDQECGGTLEYVGPNTDPGAQPGDAVFRERITYGTDRCIDEGTVLLRPSGRYLIYAWAITGRPTVAAARLERED